MTARAAAGRIFRGNIRVAHRPLRAEERRLAYVVADFIRRRLGQGRSDGAILAQVEQLRPDLPAQVLSAAELLSEARADGWPETGQ